MKLTFGEIVVRFVVFIIGSFVAMIAISAFEPQAWESSTSTIIALAIGASLALFGRYFLEALCLLDFITDIRDFFR